MKQQDSFGWISKHIDLVILILAAILLWRSYGENNEVMLNVLLLSIGAFSFEKNYVSRTGVLPNVAGIYFIFKSAVLPAILNYYLLTGLVLGTISLYFYLQKESMPNELYTLTYPLYSLKTILAFYVPYLLFGLKFDEAYWITFFVLLFAIWTFAVKRADNRPPFDGWNF